MTEHTRFTPEDAETWRPASLPPLANPWALPDYRPAVDNDAATASSGDVLAPPATPLWERRGTAPHDPQEESPATPPARTELPAAAERTTNREKGERVELHGYVAGHPWFGVDRRGVPTCVFPLATHPEPDETVTWRIRAKRERAQRLQGQLHRGDAVTVVGYRHREVLHRGGRDQVSDIVNLVALRT